MFDQIFLAINSIYSIPDLIGWGGYAILFLVMYVETGLFVGFFLPGDSLLITAGIFAAAGKLDIAFLNILLVIAAIIGDSTGYYFGQRIGRPLFESDSRIFKAKYLHRAKSFYDRHGGKTIILARFMPIIRTFAPIVAGTAEMHYRKFLLYNIVGAVVWVTGMTLVGYYIGSVVPNIEKNMGILVIIIVILSFIPGVIGYWKERRNRKSISPVPALA